jgi:hypothetical protein
MRQERAVEIDSCGFVRQSLFFRPLVPVQFQTASATILFLIMFAAQWREFSLIRRVLFRESAHQREVIHEGKQI